MDNLVKNIVFFLGILGLAAGFYMIFYNRKQQKNNENVNAIDALSMVGGMSYSLNDEAFIMKRLRNETIEEHSNYADVVCRSHAQDEEFLKAQMDACAAAGDKLYYDPAAHNPTSLGNMAYIAVYSPEPYKSQSKEYYTRLFDYMKENNII